MKVTPKQYSIAIKFSEYVRQALSPVQLADVLNKNHAEPNKNICHTHDYIDANMLMQKAMLDEGISPWQEKDRDANWDASWNFAKASNFFQTGLEHMLDYDPKKETAHFHTADHEEEMAILSTLPDSEVINIRKQLIANIVFWDNKLAAVNQVAKERGLIG